jgi:hypothetical protein
MKITTNSPCPYLPEAPPAANYRILRESGAPGSHSFYQSALRYTQYLWIHGLPARAILALCRGLYAAEETSLKSAATCPYQAYLWMIKFPDPVGFLGNPRISFQHQTIRMPLHSTALKRCRAHALWLLTLSARPDFPADPDELEPDKKVDPLRCDLAKWAGNEETLRFLNAVQING